MAQNRNEVISVQEVLNGLYMFAQIATQDGSNPLTQSQVTIKNFLASNITDIKNINQLSSDSLVLLNNKMLGCLSSAFGTVTSNGRSKTPGRNEFYSYYEGRNFSNPIKEGAATTVVQLLKQCEIAKISAPTAPPISQPSNPIQNTTTSTNPNPSNQQNEELEQTPDSLFNVAKDLRQQLAALSIKTQGLSIASVGSVHGNQLNSMQIELGHIASSTNNQTIRALATQLIQAIISAKEVRIDNSADLVDYITNLYNYTAHLNQTATTEATVTSSQNAPPPPPPPPRNNSLSAPITLNEVDKKTRLIDHIRNIIGTQMQLSDLEFMTESLANTIQVVNNIIATETASPDTPVELKDSDYEAFRQFAHETAIARLKDNLRRTSPPLRLNGQKPTPSETTSFPQAIEAIKALEDEIEELEAQIDPDNDDNDDLLAKQQQLAGKQSTLRQAQTLVERAETCVQASQTQTDPSKQLVLLNQAQQTLNQVVDTIEAANTPNNNKVNTLIIDEARRQGQTCLIQGVKDRAKLAGDFMQSHQLLPKSGTPSTFASSAKIVGGDTGVMFRGQALGAHDVVQYTELVNNGKEVIYSEIYQNKAGEPVATDRSCVSTEDDMKKAAMIQAENILANYKGKGKGKDCGEIVITLDVKSGNDKKSADNDLKRLHMLYAAILHCSKKSTFDFSSYPPIRVVHPDFKAPQLTRLGVTSSSRANAYITTHLGGNPDGYSTHGDMSKQFKELRTHYKDIFKTLTPGGGVDKGQVVTGKVGQQQLVNATNTPHSQQKHQKQQYNNHSAMTPVQPIDNLYEGEPPVINRRNSF